MSDDTSAENDFWSTLWKRTLIVARGFYQDVFANRIVDVAAAVAFYALLAIFPGVAAFVSLYALFADASTIADHLRWLRGVLPAGGFDLIADQIHYLTRTPQSALSITFAVGLVISFWSANSGVMALIDALNLVHREFERRPMKSLLLVSFSFTAGLIVLSLLSFAVAVAIPLVLVPLGLTEETIGLAFSWLRWPILFLAIVTLFSMLYLFGPSRPTARLGDVVYGALTAAVLSLATSLAFSWYVASFGTFAATYGSLGAVAGFIVWLWLSTIIVLFGAELNVGLARIRAERRPSPSVPEQKSDE